MRLRHANQAHRAQVDCEQLRHLWGQRNEIKGMSELTDWMEKTVLMLLPEFQHSTLSLLSAQQDKTCSFTISDAINKWSWAVNNSLI